MSITPDTKNWTWVLERRCPDCGFDAGGFGFDSLPALIRENAATFLGLLADPRVRTRPSPGTWSALEYACHVRDVYRRFGERLALMVEQDDPMFANWDQDVTAVEDRYGEQDPGVVGPELVAAAEATAAAFESVEVDRRGRRGRRSDGSVFTVESLGRYMIHDPVHHVRDVEVGYARIG